MNLAYYSGYKEKETFRRCMDVLAETEAEVNRYDRIEDTLYVTLGCYTEEKEKRIQKAFIKAGYLDFKVVCKDGKTKWSHMKAYEYYHEQYNKVLKKGYLEPLIMTFLEQFLYYNIEVKDRVSDKVECPFTVGQTRQNLSEIFQYFTVKDKNEENRLTCLVMAILHSAKLVNNNIIIRFVFLQQDREIVYGISSFVSTDRIDKTVKSFMNKLDKSKIEKVINVVDWEVEYIKEYISDEMKMKIKSSFHVFYD